MSFKRLDPEDFLTSAQAVSQTCWSNNAPVLETFFTSSTQAASISGKYYLNVFQTGSDNANAVTQFNIAFGDETGRGTVLYNSQVSSYSPSRTIYGQYRSLMLEDENAEFNFGGVVSQYFYAISIERARYKEKLFNGSLDLRLSGSSTDAGTLTDLRLTDNSNDVSTPSYFGVQPYYQIISGSQGTAYNKTSGINGNTTGYTANSGSYGFFFPDTATLLLNGSALDLAANQGISLGTGLSDNVDQDNPFKLFQAISGSGNFGLNCEETITSDFVFIRARNSEFNYSENPSFISGSTGEVIYSNFINNPQVYMTTVGMYNDANELLAVAKLSRPLLKDFTKESLIRVKLDF